MTPMDPQSFGLVVAETMDAIRESLVAIEAAAQEQDLPTYHALARLYASTLPPLRDYLAGLQAGRPMPRNLGTRLLEVAESLTPLAGLVERLGLHPDLGELRGLAALAGSVAQG